MTTPTLALPAPRERVPSIAFPLVLISLGVAFLLVNMGYLAGLTWTEVLQLWPVLLVLAGVDILLRPRSFAIAALVEIAIVVAAFLFLMTTPAALNGPGTLQFSTDVPRDGATELAVSVDYGAGRLTLAGGATGLMTVDSTRQDVTQSVSRSGGAATAAVSSSSSSAFIFDGRDRQWNVRVPSDVPTAIILNLGAGQFDVGLSDVRVTRASINTGASDLTVRLPTPRGDVPFTISGGMSDIKLYVPSGVAYRITHSSVLQSLNGPTESANYDTSSDRLTITLSTAMSAVTIR